jgi:hypothetical protein
MIIVITDNGNEYINDNSIQTIQHQRNERIASIFLDKERIPARHIYDVQQIVYIGNNSDVTIKEDSDVVVDLKKLLKEEEARYDDLLKHSAMMRAYAFKLMKRDPELYDKINEEVQQEFKDYLNSKRNEQDQSKPSD